MVSETNWMKYVFKHDLKKLEKEELKCLKCLTEFINTLEGYKFNINIIDEIKKIPDAKFQEFLDENDHVIDTENTYMLVVTQLLVPITEIEESNSETLTKFVDLSKNHMTILSVNTDDRVQNDEDDRKANLGFLKSFFLVKRLIEFWYRNNMELKILLLGPSQVGKTMLIEKLFGIKKSTIKGGMGSDTSHIKPMTQTVNKVKITFVDCPGFFDSRGKDVEEQNMKKLMEYVENNKFDLILYVQKCGTMIDRVHQELIKDINKKLGADIWRKTIIVLTHANEGAPEEYYKNKDGVDDITITKLDAWKKYTAKRIETWKKTFHQYQPNIPVVLVENNSRECKMIKGIPSLYDGTPILETLISQIFTVCENDKKPLAFLSLVKEGNKENNTAINAALQIEATGHIIINNPPPKKDDYVICDHTKNNVTVTPSSSSSSTSKPEPPPEKKAPTFWQKILRWFGFKC